MPTPRRMPARSPRTAAAAVGGVGGAYRSPAAASGRKKSTPTSMRGRHRYSSGTTPTRVKARSRSTERVFNFGRPRTPTTSRGHAGRGGGLTPRKTASMYASSRPRPSVGRDVEASSYSLPLGLSRPARPTTSLGLASKRAPQPKKPAPKIYRSPQHFPSRDLGVVPDENYQWNHTAQNQHAAQHAAQVRQLQAATSGRGRAMQRGPSATLPPPRHHNHNPNRPRPRSPFGRFSLSPSRRRAARQNLNFSHEVETYLYEPGSEYSSVHSTDPEGRTQLTRMLGGDKRLSQKVKAHIDRKVGEEAEARFEQMTLKEQMKIRSKQRAATAKAKERAAAAASRKKKAKSKKKRSKKAGRSSRSYSSDEESDASLGEIIDEACTLTGKKAAKYFEEEESSDCTSEESEEEDTEYTTGTMGTMTILEKADMLAKQKKKNGKSKSKKGGRSSSRMNSSSHHHSLPEGCRIVKCPPGRLGISIDTSAQGPAIGYIAPRSPLIGKVEVGDIIAKIDKEDVTHLDAEDVMDILSSRRDEYRRLTIQE